MISDNLREVEQELRDSCALASRQRNEVTLIAVTKTVDAKFADRIVELGVNHLAENRMESFLAKKEAMVESSTITWHFIGNLQRRKVKSIINEIDYFHALDSLKLAAEIQKRAKKVIRCFIEVNVSGETSKQGIAPAELLEFVAELADFDQILVVGLMTMAPFDATAEQQHLIFAKLKELQESIQEKALMYAPCTETSMGMSNDFSIAIQEGSTYVRIGTALFKE